ncbi:hypothetical protein [Streptomyces sp. NPDC001820]|uniref:hypothetical protein n=1 Tax=Streptomyces sp. NPDC001820 TaxID=3364613 RepID=UPI0036A6251D
MARYSDLVAQGKIRLKAATTPDSTGCRGATSRPMRPTRSSFFSMLDAAREAGLAAFAPGVAD